MAVSKSNFFKDHYDWLVALVGIALLAGVGYLFATSQDNSPEAARAACEAELKASNTPSHKKVPSVEEKVTWLGVVEYGFKNPAVLDPVSDVEGNFLASEYRVYCKSSEHPLCRKPIPFKSEVCPWCQGAQPSEKPEEVERKGSDSDDDGMTDAWEKRYGFDPNNAADAAGDADGDAFTNLEEYEAKTDPKDPEDHPDYLDSLTLAGELRTENLPFWISDVTPVAGGNYRVWFEATDPKFTNTKVSAVKGQEPAFMLRGAKWNAEPEKSGWRIVKIEKKAKTVQKAGAGQKMVVDDFSVDLERVSDKVAVSVPWKVKSFPIEEQIDLHWDRGNFSKTFTVAKGAEFELNKRKYKVKSLQKGSVTVFDLKKEANKTIGEVAAETKPSSASKSKSNPSPTQQKKRKP